MDKKSLKPGATKPSLLKPGAHWSKSEIDENKISKTKMIPSWKWAVNMTRNDFPSRQHETPKMTQLTPKIWGE